MSYTDAAYSVPVESSFFFIKNLSSAKITTMTAKIPDVKNKLKGVNSNLDLHFAKGRFGRFTDGTAHQ